MTLRMTLTEALSKVESVRHSEEILLFLDEIDALDVVLEHAKIGQRALEVAPLMDNFMGSLTVTADSSDDDDSFMVMGNVDTRLLHLVGML